MSDITKKQETFFKLVFGSTSGLIAIAHMNTGVMYENYFEYPDELPQMLAHIQRFSLEYNIYFCPQVLSAKRRTKDNVAVCPTVWADLDECSPEKVLLPPSVTLETSPGRYQALWIMERPVQPEIAEDLSRRIAYTHADEGADKSGWDLTQLLRVPLTKNLKYAEQGFPVVKVLDANQKRYRLSDFEKVYSETKGLEFLDIPFPEELPDITPEKLLEKKKSEINPHVWGLYYETLKKDWSKSLWRLELILLESDYTREETFVIAKASACNKYKRDKKPEIFLWKEVLKADALVQKSTEALFTLPKKHELKLLTDKEKEHIQQTPTIVEDYVEWAKTLGDAAWQYHQVGAFVILSTLLSSSLRLPTSYGLVIPNLWFLIMADTTLTRKTTAMDLAMDIILDIDSDAILATDGSIEGLLTSLSTRPGRASVFLRDEFSGLIEMMTKRDYYAGMAEMLTKMYDGKFQKRVLRKEIIEVREPILILFAGGIKSRIYELLDYRHVSSGFLPRFCIVTAESDVTKLKPLGPPTDISTGQQQKLTKRLRDLHNHFEKEQIIKVAGKEVATKVRYNAELTSDAWVRYNRFETQMVSSVIELEAADLLTPTMDRLAKSGLKMAVLLAAARGEESVVVTEEDVVRAFYYVETWSHYTMEALSNIGKTATERTLERIFRSVRRHPGITRSTLMQHHHLTAREAEAVFTTLEQRGLIRRRKQGRAEYLEPVEYIGG